MNKSHEKYDGLNDEGVPVEIDSMALIVADKNSQQGAAYYQAKYLIEFLLHRLGVKLTFKPIESDNDDALFAPFEYRRSAMVADGDKIIGVIGEYKKSV